MKVQFGNSYPLPNITDILDQFGKSKYFTMLEFASGFYQIQMNEQDKEKAEFSTPYGHYEFNRLPFWLKGAPACINNLLKLC